ncbi:MAG: DUF5640 domain-containing protein [Vulcanimicrobiota bacterium]
MTRAPQKITLTMVLLTLLVVAIAVAEHAHPIVGAWEQADKGTHWTFRADGTGLMERTEPKYTARFKWTLRGNTLSLSTAGRVVPYQIIQHDAHNLVIRNPQVSQIYQLSRL